MSIARARASLLALLLLALPAWSAAATRYDPRLHFRTYRTPHFDVHAHQGEEALARRLTTIVERVRTRLSPALGLPRGRVQVILVDQTDVANGWATPFPYDAIELTAVPPVEEDLIGNTTDWLELAFTHEYTHILHLDRSRGLMQGVRRVFGRAPLVFPNTFLPIWQIEGLATYEESRMTGEGRVPAGDFRAIVDTAARQGRFAPIDRASGGLDDWPAGNAAYAYGAYFHQYLADRFGAERVDALADATAGRVPLFGAGAFRRVFGESVTTLWREFGEAKEKSAPPPGATDTATHRLTHHGYVVAAPRVGPDGALYYRVAGADGFPALLRSANGRPRRLAWRVLGDRTSVRGDWVVFDQLERVGAVALYSDLYAVRRSGGGVIRLTRAARAAAPDVSPDGRRIACVVGRTGRRALALLDFAPDGGVSDPRILIDDPQSDYTGPRWSPDGTRIAAERRRAGAYELVIVDPASRDVRVLVARVDARLVTPSWTPDGRTLLFAANVGDRAFNIFAADVASGLVRQLTDSVTGAQFPDVAPDGSLVYLGYSADGYDLFSVPLDAQDQSSGSSRLEAGGRRLQAGDWRLPPGDPGANGRVNAAGEISGLKAGATYPNDQRPKPNDRAPNPNDGAPNPDERPTDGATYNPLRTLAPTYWEPVIASDAGETLIGAATAAFDALGRHAYAASAAWSAARARPDWSVSYAYDRWRPTLVGSYTDDTDPVRGGEVRSRELFAGALFPVRRVRWSETAMAGFDAATDTLACAAACPAAATRRDLRSLRAGWLFDSRRLFRYSVSAEEGVAIEAAVETSRRGLGSDADANAAIVDVRGFHRLFGRHTVLAVRAAAASGWGDPAARRRFSAAGPGPSQPAFDFGRDTIGLLRGFDREAVVGAHAAVVNADVRTPLLRVQRGFGTWPLFLRSVHGALFVDAGHAWDAAFRAGDIRRSAGAELSLDLVLLHAQPVTIAAGAAATRDPSAGRTRAAAFTRIGYAF